MIAIFDAPFPEMMQALQSDKYERSSPYVAEADASGEFLEWFVQDGKRVVRMIIRDDGTTWYEAEDNTGSKEFASLKVSKSGNIFSYVLISETMNYVRQTNSQTYEIDDRIESSLRRLFGVEELKSDAEQKAGSESVYAIRYVNDRGQQYWQPVCEGDGLFRTSNFSIIPRLRSDAEQCRWQKHDTGLGPMLYASRKRAEMIGHNEQLRRNRKQLKEEKR